MGGVKLNYMFLLSVLFVHVFENFLWLLFTMLFCVNEINFTFWIYLLFSFLIKARLSCDLLLC